MHAWDQDGSSDGDLPDVELVIRDLRPGDEAQLVRLWRELMDLHVELDDRFTLSENADDAFMSYLETARCRDDYGVRVAEADGRLLGFVIMCVLPNSPVYRTRWIGYINDLCVTAGARRQGIGEALVRDAVAWLERNGADSVEVYVSKRNEVAQRFWRRVGGIDYLDRFSIELPRPSKIR